jgi:hypothetical protein
VSDDESAGRVPKVYAAGREPLQFAGAAFDAVKLLPHVEPGEGNVFRLEHREGPARIDDLGFDAPADRGGDERVVCRAVPMGNDGELHTEIVLTSQEGVGRDPVT